MTAIERAIAQTEAWVEAIDRERDGLAGVGLADRAAVPLDPAWVRARLAQLEGERRDAIALVEALRKLRYRPELMFRVRPRMLRVPLRRGDDRQPRAEVG